MTITTQTTTTTHDMQMEALQQDFDAADTKAKVARMVELLKANIRETSKELETLKLLLRTIEGNSA